MRFNRWSWMASAHATDCGTQGRTVARLALAAFKPDVVARMRRVDPKREAAERLLGLATRRKGR